MEAEIKHRAVPQANGVAGSPKDDLVKTDIDAAATGPQKLRPLKAKHGRGMQILRGVSLFLYFFLSCIA